MRVAICAFVMLEVLATASSMNTEGRQLRMVNRLTEADPEPKSDDVIEATNPKDIIKKGETVAKPEKKITGTPVDKVAVKGKIIFKVSKKSAGSPVDKAAVKRPTLKLVGPKKYGASGSQSGRQSGVKSSQNSGGGRGAKNACGEKSYGDNKKGSIRQKQVEKNRIRMY